MALLLMLLMLVGFSSMMRPSPLAADALLAEFSAARAQTHIDEIAVEPHPMGSEANGRVRAYLTGRLVALGLEPELVTAEVPDYFGAPGETVTVVDVLARIAGRDSSRVIALVAHYDTVPTTSGANDNSAGVAAILEAARALVAAGEPATDVILLFTDGEEPYPRFGAVAFAGLHPWFDDIDLVVNLEAIGSSGPSMLVETSPSRTPIVRDFAIAAARPAAFSFLTEMVDLFGGVGTDFDVFKDRGVPGLSFAYLRGSSIYHTDRDSIETVSSASLQHHGDNLVASVRGFGERSPQASVDPPGEVYFALTPFFFVEYSASAAAVLGLALLGAFAAIVFFGVRSERIALGAIGRGAAVLLVGSMAAALVVYAVWWLFTAVRSTPGVWESYAYLVVLFGVAGIVLSFVGGAVAGRYTDFELSAGIVLVWVVLAVVTAGAMPGFSYLFFWPALGGVIALGLNTSGRFGTWLWLVVAAPAVVLSIPALDAFFQMAQPRPGNPDSDLTETVAVVALLSALVIGLIVPFLSAARRRP
jgi:hypothetical protein